MIEKKNLSMNAVTLLTIMESAFSTCTAEVRQNLRWDDDTTVEVRILGCTEEVRQNSRWDDDTKKVIDGCVRYVKEKVERE